jgi:hypothetical protein
MTDDLVKRLRCLGDHASFDPHMHHTAADRIEKLEAALRNIVEGDIPRTVKIPFRDDGQSSKHDRCEHGQWFYEDCGCCIEDYARKALEGKDD